MSRLRSTGYVTCGEEPGNLLALAILPRRVRVAPRYQARDGRQQVEDHHREGIPVAETRGEKILN